MPDDIEAQVAEKEGFLEKQPDAEPAMDEQPPPQAAQQQRPRGWHPAFFIAYARRNAEF
jgi:hypothetical protein